jgi:predicted NBD/HSP70 family sugar kinase
MQINNNFQKNANISMVAQLLWRTPGISRVEIARQLDLYRSTVSNIINTLIENGVVFEEKEGISMPQGGRKPICLGLNAQFGCVAGIEIQPSGYHAVIIDVFGTALFSVEKPLPEGSFSEIIELVIDEVLGARKELPLPLLAICVGVPGIVDMVNGIIVRSDPFHLRDYAFAKSFSAKYHVPVMVENDANCLAWLELANNRGDNIKNFLCVNAEYQSKEARYGDRSGMSVGLGLAFDGGVFSGSKHAAGEFVSLSWRKEGNGQTGLPPSVMANLETDAAAFEEWVVDLFSSLVPVVSVLDPETVFAHGELARRSSDVSSILERRVPQFLSLLDRSSCAFTFSGSSSLSVATGSAQMFFLHLFSVPAASGSASQVLADWDAVFRMSNRGVAP